MQVFDVAAPVITMWVALGGVDLRAAGSLSANCLHSALHECQFYYLAYQAAMLDVKREGTGRGFLERVKTSMLIGIMSSAFILIKLI